MKHQFLPNSDEATTGEMLKRIGVSSIEDLFNDIPEEFTLRRTLNLPPGKGEQEVLRILESKLSRNRVPPDALCFLGGGVWPHYVPAAVDEISSRSEFVTSYTPYQPEISQGMLHALFEYQSLICDLTEMGAANSSMYDWASAAAEAARMAHRISRRRKVVFAGTAGRERLSVMKTYCEPLGVEVVPTGFDLRAGRTNVEAVRKHLGDDTAALYIENPNFFGVLEEEVEQMGELAHSRGAILIVGVDPTSLGLLRPPGDYGADIVVGEGLNLGTPMNYGGPAMGIFACRDDQQLIRQMPGRIIGMTRTADGAEKAFCMVLQTREQHIRRENATSNICTNEALLAVRSAAYLALMGPDGMKELGIRVVDRSHRLSSLLADVDGIKSPAFASPYFKDLTVVLNRGHEPERIFERLMNEGILGGFPLERHYPEMSRMILFSVTEDHTEEDLQLLQEACRRSLEG